MTAIVKAESGGEMAAWEVMRQQAVALVASRLLPRSVDTPEKAIAIIQTGRELGIGPMQALRSIHVIEGKPTMSAELMAGLVLARLPGAVLRVASSSNDECTVIAARPHQPESSFSFSMSDAKAAGLAGKDNWKKYPAAMLRARCLAAASRAIFPDATMGMLTPDELGVETDERGYVETTGEVTPLHHQLPKISPHSHPDEPDVAGDPDVYADFAKQLETLKKDILACDSYDKALACEARVRAPGGKQSPLTKGIQVAKEAGKLSDDMRSKLAKVWHSCVYEVDKKLKELKPPMEASFVDEPDDVDPDIERAAIQAEANKDEDDGK